MLQINDIPNHPALTDASTNITVIFDPHTFLPTRVRVYEDHQIFGRSTNDILLYNYTVIDGISFAQNVKLLYNEDLMILEMLYESFNVNPVFPPNFFSGLSIALINQTVLGLPPKAAEVSNLYNSAEVFDSS